MALTAEEVLAGSALTHEVELPAEVLGTPAAGDPPLHSRGEGARARM